MTRPSTPITRNVPLDYDVPTTLRKLRHFAATVRPTSERYEAAHRMITEHPQFIAERGRAVFVWS